MKTMQQALCLEDSKWLETLIAQVAAFADGNIRGSGDAREALAKLGLPSLRHMRAEENQEYRVYVLTEPGDRLVITDPRGITEHTLGPDTWVLYELPSGGGPGRYRTASLDCDKYGSFYQFFGQDLSEDDVVFRGDDSDFKDFSLKELLDSEHARRFERPDE